MLFHVYAPQKHIDHDDVWNVKNLKETLENMIFSLHEKMFWCGTVAGDWAVAVKGVRTLKAKELLTDRPTSEL